MDSLSDIFLQTSLNMNYIVIKYENKHDCNIKDSL